MKEYDLRSTDPKEVIQTITITYMEMIDPIFDVKRAVYKAIRDIRKEVDNQGYQEYFRKCQRAGKPLPVPRGQVIDAALCYLGLSEDYSLLRIQPQEGHPERTSIIWSLYSEHMS